jgi:hypothetical protein
MLVHCRPTAGLLKAYCCSTEDLLLVYWRPTAGPLKANCWSTEDLLLVYWRPTAGLLKGHCEYVVGRLKSRTTLGLLDGHSRNVLKVLCRHNVCSTCIHLCSLFSLLSSSPFNWLNFQNSSQTRKIPILKPTFFFFNRPNVSRAHQHFCGNRTSEHLQTNGEQHDETTRGLRGDFKARYHSY